MTPHRVEHEDGHLSEFSVYVHKLLTWATDNASAIVLSAVLIIVILFLFHALMACEVALRPL